MAIFTIPFTPDLFGTLFYIVWATAIGLELAAVAVLIRRLTVGRFLTQLTDAGATSEENAATLASLSLGWSARWLLRRGAPLRRLIVCVGAATEEAKEATDEEKKGKKTKDPLLFAPDAPFYLPEAQLSRFDTLQKQLRKEPLWLSLLSVALFALLLFAAAMVVLNLFYHFGFIT